MLTFSLSLSCLSKCVNLNFYAPLDADLILTLFRRYVKFVFHKPSEGDILAMLALP